MGKMMIYLLLAVASGENCFKHNWNYPGNDISDKHHTNESAVSCQAECKRNSRCTHFTYNQNEKKCWLKKGDIPEGEAYTAVTAISGPKECGQEAERENREQASCVDVDNTNACLNTGKPSDNQWINYYDSCEAVKWFCSDQDFPEVNSCCCSTCGQEAERENREQGISSLGLTKKVLWGLIGTTVAVGTTLAGYYVVKHFFLSPATKNSQSANLENKRQEGRKSDKPSDEEESKEEEAAANTTVAPVVAAEDTKNRNKSREEDILIVVGTIVAALLIFCFLCRYFCLRKRTASGAKE